MISQKLILQVQNCASKLTNDLVHTLQSSNRCPTYRTIPPDRLIDLKNDLYQNLGRWLSSRSRTAVETRYFKLGHERYMEGIPLSEVIFAQGVTKSMLLNFIDRCMLGNSEDLKLEHELVLAISEFFDEVTYWVSAGYEDAGRARLASPMPVEAARVQRNHKLEPARAGFESAGEEELAVSRGGDIGEASG
jgi:hypothetical protein